MSEVKLDPAANQREPGCPLASVKMKLSLRDAAYVNDRQVLESFRAMRLIERNVQQATEFLVAPEASQDSNHMVRDLTCQRRGTVLYC